MSPTQIAACAVAAVLLFWMLGAYNRLVRLRQAVAQAFGQIETEFARRHELIPQLIEAAHPHLSDEPQTLVALEAARNQARAAVDHAAPRPASVGRLASLGLAEQVLRAALSQLMVSVKARPALRADPALRQRLEAVAMVHSRLSVARQTFNDAVLGYNGSVQQFPTRLIAGMLGFRAAGTF